MLQLDFDEWSTNITRFQADTSRIEGNTFSNKGDRWGGLVSGTLVMAVNDESSYPESTFEPTFQGSLQALMFHV